MGEVLQTEQAKRYGLTRERFDALPVVERFAWNWAILNERAIDDLAHISTARRLSYQDLWRRGRPRHHARHSLSRASTGIRRPTHSSSAARVPAVLTGQLSGASGRHHGGDEPVFKDLSVDDQRRIRAVVQETSLASASLLEAAGLVTVQAQPLESPC